MTEIVDWINSLPIFTRNWLTLSMSLTLIAHFGFLNPMNLFLIYEPFINRLQIWRPVTALLYYPLSPSTGLHYLINCYFLYKYSTKLERDFFAGKPAEYLFLLLFTWMCTTIIALFGQMILLMDPMVMSILYIWCNLNPDVIITFFLGSQFEAKYLPWVLLGFNTIVNGGLLGIQQILGIIVGHIYFFVMFKYPEIMGGQPLIKIPQILYEWFPSQIGVRGFQAEQRTSRGRYKWGTGQVLGGK